MWKDTLVEETRAVHAEYAAQFEHNLDDIFHDLKEKEAHNRERVVRLEPRRLAPVASGRGIE